MFQTKIKLSATLLDKLNKASELQGCASVQEFAEQVLEREADKLIAESGELSEQEVEDIANKLKGLGYLD